jgi:hypothetical protein
VNASHEANSSTKFSSSASASTSTSTTQQPPAKKSKLFGHYNIIPSVSSATTISLLQQIQCYLQANFDSSQLELISFWQRKEIIHDCDKLYKAALRVMSIPASSSPIERVFSHRGIIFRPHRSNLSDTKLSSLIF